MRFGISWGITFVVALVFPIAILFNEGLPWTDRVRWIQNNLSFSVFLLIPYPLAVGVFASTFRVKDFAQLPARLKVPFAGVLILLLSLALVTVIQDALKKESTIAPYELRDASGALELERRMRAAVQAKIKSGAGARAEYVADPRVRYFSSLQDLWARGSVATKWAKVLHWMGSWFGVIFFWYLLVVVGSTRKTHPGKDRLILSFALLITWFPMRMYSEWYINFYVLDLRSYQPFIIFSALAISGLVLVAVLLKPGSVVQIISGFIGAAVVVLGFLGKLQPSWVRFVAEAIEKVSFNTFLTIELIILLTFVALVIPVFGTRG